MSEIFFAEAELAAARAGDDAAFTRLVAPLRDGLRAHCYRMLGSVHDAEDALQEALLRAWRALPRFEGRSALRTWLYTVSTRTCLDQIESRGRRALPVDLGPAAETVDTAHVPRDDVAWLGPFPVGPAGTYERRESVELAFVAALQHLPGNQRAALLLFEVLGFSAAEIAGMMKTSVTSVNSALSRARRVIADRVGDRSQQRALSEIGDARVREIVTGFSTALELGDTDALVALLTEDVTWAMPPLPSWYAGLDSVTAFARAVPLSSCGEWRTTATEANGQPAVAGYLRGEDGRFHHWSVTVLTLRDGRVAALTSFIGAESFTAMGLPLTLG